MSALFYRAFEDKYRGSRELIGSRLEIYVPFLQPLLSLKTPATALDIGCGRGEWLELLANLGFQGRGVDLDEGMLQACRERGLDVAHSEGLATLKQTPSNSQLLVSAFHVVEHIRFEELQAMVAEALRVLVPGGLLILETPNPENIEVGTSNFYLDPSHVKPLPSQLLAFVVEHTGFQRHKILRLQEAAALHGDAPVSLISVLGGVSPDYAVVAQKNGDADALHAQDHAFSKKYGLSLPELALRYDQHHAVVQQQLSEAEARAESRERHLRKLLAIVETQARQAKATAAALEASVTLLEQQLVQTTDRLQELEKRGFAVHTAGLRERLGAVKAFLRHPRPGPIVRRLSKVAKKLGVHGPMRAVYVRMRSFALARMKKDVDLPPAPTPQTPSDRPLAELSDDARSVWNQLNIRSQNKHEQGVD
ncbi:bifunctional 2-polyprenyl-6-hydroxyphenol methylase/3-demethylubiquinol 3-O-methyltransferase UbiG [Variovorax sp. OV084]|jgi:O-antigen chain-terminating methyltransferase|uniref:class I SAM-dependent methyltransferase n=1 Tax=Variovorax sp. OV084 TaxID=1882777 RepID=UPI0008D32181|nr:class I SAM-dependent methyltransferase [Variovorax sp. OV084]SEU03141.1 O-antigen chain-terminating methyltransferase [Variovorax sp. OV084]